MRRRRKQPVNNDENREIETVLVMDYFALMFRQIFAAMKGDKYCSDNYALWKSYMLIGKNGDDGIFGYIQKFKPDRIVLAIDEKNNWRKDLYSEYKAHRGAIRKKSNVNFNEFFPIAEKFLEELQDIFHNIVFLKVPLCEGDDLVAVLSQDIYPDDKLKKFIIAASDKDFLQLQTNKNVVQYCPLIKQYRVCSNPDMTKRIKIIDGDIKDNIPGLKLGVGPAKAEKILKEGLDEFLDSEEDMRDRYALNRSLIDFDYIPDEIRKSIIDAYNAIEVKEVNRSGFFNFFIRNKLAGVAAEFNVYSRDTDRLI
jgi:5'-3' exonuclease